MAKGKFSGTERYNGSHRYPKEFETIYEKIKNLKFVEELGLGRYFKSKNKKTTLKIKGFDDLKKSYVASLKGKNFEQKIFIKVREKNLNQRKTLEDINF